MQARLNIRINHLAKPQQNTALCFFDHIQRLAGH